jgi:hypothetical protein
VPCGDATLVGGYKNASGSELNTGLEYGLDFVDTELGFIVAELQSAGLAGDTLVIIEAKHGQSPIDVTLKQDFDDAPYNATPGFGSNGSKTTDDVALVWLSPQMQQTSYKAAEAYLLSQATTLGIDTLLNKSALAPLYGNPFGNNRTPDFIAITIHGLIYTSGTKLAEHGGFFVPDDRSVALLVSNPSITAAIVKDDVETRQIAPTILSVFGINPNELEGARRENSKVLPGL